MAETYFTSDTHFFHSNIIKYDPRPFKNLDEMHEALISNWNNLVKFNDTVWVLGDFALASFVEIKVILNQLNGNKNLVLGNHDRTATSMKNAGFDLVVKEFRTTWYKPGFDETSKTVRVVQKPFSVVYSHFPYGGAKGPKDDEKSWLIHGHIHNSAPAIQGERRMVNVGCMNWNYCPVHIETIKGAITEYEERQKDSGRSRSREFSSS